AVAHAGFRSMRRFENLSRAAFEQYLRDRAAEFARLRAFAGRGVTNHGRAIGRKDSARQEHLCIFERGEGADGDLAAPPEFAEHRALRCYGQPCPRIVERGAGFECGAVLERFDGERALADRGAHDVRTESFADDVAPAETPQSRGRQHDGIVLAFFYFADARVDVAANGLNIEIRPHAPQLRDAPQRAGSDLRAEF